VATPADSSDDVYCVVAYAAPGYKTLTITWNYTDSTGTHVITPPLPDIPIRTVTLVKKGDGLVGAPAEVCTSGWDPQFMTGRTNNTNTNAVNDPDPVDDVVAADFVLNPAVGPTVSAVRRSGVEWCALVASTVQTVDIDVDFNFDVVYNRATEGGATPRRLANADDQRLPVSPSLPNDQANLVDIISSVELRHVTADGNFSPAQASEQLVIGSIHFICLVGTDATDSLVASGLTINPVGGLDVPNVSGLTIFHKAPADPRLTGVTDGTICFSYTSSSPGEQT
jgi:hypothetical protein